MTVVDKIISLIDERITIRAECKDHRPENRARIDVISTKLDEIRRTCPQSWKQAERILNR